MISGSGFNQELVAKATPTILNPTNCGLRGKMQKLLQQLIPSILV